jgi:hypothetical protein
MLISVPLKKWSVFFNGNWGASFNDQYAAIISRIKRSLPKPSDPWFPAHFGY